MYINGDRQFFSLDTYFEYLKIRVFMGGKKFDLLGVLFIFGSL